MRLRVSLTPDFGPVVTAQDTAVIIDVLRATSVMTTALAAGAERIVTYRDVDSAREFAASVGSTAGLCGERDCIKIEGFDFGNSPAEYTSTKVRDRTLVLTTTNGTYAIAAAESARRMIVASFLNIAAVIRNVRGDDCVHLVCAGTNRAVSNEDVLLAGAIAVELCRKNNATLDGDEAGIAAALWRERFGTSVIDESDNSDTKTQQIRLVADQLALSLGGRNLVKLGYKTDLMRCANLNSIDRVAVRMCDDRTDGAATEFRLDELIANV